MAGFLSDRNEIATAGCALTSNVAWAETAPLEALRTTPLIDAAVSSVLGTAAEPVVIDAVWDSPIFLTYGGLFDTNLRQSAFVRFEAFADAAGESLLFTTVNAAGRDRRVVPPLTDPATLRFGAPNQMRGDLDPRDFRLYPTHVHVIVPLCRVRRVRWTIWGGAYQEDDSPDTAYRIGLAWAGDGLFFSRHVGASAESVKSGDERIETPGGGVWVEPGLAKRVALIDRTVTDPALRDAFFDMALRNGKSRPLVWLPNVIDPGACFRYGGLFRRSDDHQHKHIARGYASSSLELEEWTE